MFPPSPVNKYVWSRIGKTWISPSCGSGSIARLVSEGRFGSGFNFARPSASVAFLTLSPNSGYIDSAPARLATKGSRCCSEYSRANGCLPNKREWRSSAGCGDRVLPRFGSFPLRASGRAEHRLHTDDGGASDAKCHKTAPTDGRQRPQTACLVQGESAIVGELGTTAALERVFMQSRCPVSCNVDVECPGRLSCRGHRPLRIKDRAHQY